MDGVGVGVVSIRQSSRWNYKREGAKEQDAYLRSIGTRNLSLLKLLLLVLVLIFGSTKRDCEGLGFDSGNVMSSEREAMRA